MLRRLLVLPWGVCCAVLFGSSLTVAADKKIAVQEDWQVRTFDVPPSGFVNLQPDGRPFIDNSAPPFPPANAPESTWVERVRHDTTFFRDWLKPFGFDLPEHSAVLIDPARNKVCLRTTGETMDVLDAELGKAEVYTPSTLAFIVDSYRVDGAMALSVAHEAAGKEDVDGLLENLNGLATAGKAQRLPSIYLETRSGQRGVRQSGEERATVTKVSLDSEGNVFANTESLPSETSLEIDPVLGPDDQTIDVNVSLTWPFGAKMQRNLFVGQTAAGRLEVPVTDSRWRKVVTAMMIGSGRTKLLSISPVGDTWGKDGHEIVFLRGDAIKVARAAMNTPLENLLLKLADKAVGKPSEVKVVLEGPSDGMRTQRFKIPPGFLAFGSEAPPAPVDPFAPAQEQPATRRPTAKDVLINNGIVFPAGASARFNPATSTFVVRNTEAALSQVEALMGDIVRCPPQAVQITLFIAQADAKSLRASVAGTTAKADHAQELAALERLATEGVADFPVILRCDTRSGQRATLESGGMHAYAGSLGEEPRKTGDAAKTGESAPKSKATSSESKTVSASIVQRMAGTRMEIDPVIGPDGVTVEVNLSLEHHYAPPTLPVAPANANAAGKLVELPGANFHCAKLTSALTVYSGMTKLLGVWRPEGPEFEGKDVMQAAFLRVDVVEVGKEGT
jgi:hypothetical protein